ncbi:hypothetical protein FB45DRAFT_887934 [Roridomyces roridus]|uniref:J domain-containing protein n=1 Tax=Roridomyces roridus TaxID=1738132 RepID=A0AAD7CJB4_9AGAR|nr:hypothetical protein FB45DRAFT_887934 [Roridomyces roridus]
MLSFALNTATNYFRLPIDEEEEKEIEGYQRKYITWVAEPSASSSLAPSPALQALEEVLKNDDLYEILGVSKTGQLGQAAEATYAFQKIAVAYSVLSQPNSRRSYDSRPPSSNYDVFSAHPMGHGQETFRSIVMGVLDDFLEGDLEMIRTFLKAVNDINPSIKMGEEGINTVLNSLQRIRERALTCRTCVYALHTEVARLLEVQHSFRQLGYFDILERTRLTIQLTRITLSLPLALEKAIAEQNASYGHRPDSDAILPRKITLLIRSVDNILQSMEGIFPGKR